MTIYLPENDIDIDMGIISPIILIFLKIVDTHNPASHLLHKTRLMQGCQMRGQIVHIGYRLQEVSKMAGIVNAGPSEMQVGANVGYPYWLAAQKVMHVLG
jgi:hypothetical protein